MALGSTQSLTEMSTRNVSWGRGESGQCWWLTRCWLSGISVDLNLRTCTGIALPLTVLCFSIFCYSGGCFCDRISILSWMSKQLRLTHFLCWWQLLLFVLPKTIWDVCRKNILSSFYKLNTLCKLHLVLLSLRKPIMIY